MLAILAGGPSTALGREPPFSFPADEGRHSGAATELWTVHAFVEGKDGKSYSLAGVLFDGRWFVLSGQLASVALTDDGAGRLVIGTNLFPPLFADVEHTEGRLHERFGRSFYRRVLGRGVELSLRTHEVSIGLRVPVENRISPLCGTGVARWGSRTVFGYGIVGAHAAGAIELDRRTIPVRGLARLDHFWSDGMEDDHDYFTASLDDGRELTVLNVHGEEGQGGLPGSCATLADNGTTIPLEGLRLQRRRSWTSPRSGVRYPVAIAIDSASPRLSITLTATADDQEASVLGVDAYHGRCAATGQVDGKAVSGACFLMLAGYPD
ncbi:MAG: hypothetical protein HY791_14320 [Deltaproteobacteria bacterium]|nr:hypothetical protein [Deltaproteobacteria bacterium]